MTGRAARVPGLLAATRDAGATDAQLLDRFVAHRDAPAFAALVARHGPMVFGVCRRIIRDWHAAEDAFQAAFLVLARKAQSVEPPGALAGWLHGVAVHVAKDARRAELRRHARERPTAELPEPAEPPTSTDAELRAVLDDELRKLPKKYRDLLVACDLEECRRAPVAAALGIPESTLSTRLMTARKMLASRLAKRGVAPAIVAGVAMDGLALAASELPRSVQASAAKLGCGTDRTVPVGVESLAKGVLRAMTHKAFAPITFLVLTTCGTLGVLTASPDAPAPPELPKPKLVLALTPRRADAPPPKAVPKPFPKGPNRILLRRNEDLVLLDPDGKNEKTIGEKDPKFGVTGAQLAPDGKRFAALVFDNQKSGDEQPKSRLYVRGLNEKEPGTDLGVTPDSFVWSRDGTEIACSEIVEENLEKVIGVTHYIVNANTKVKTAVKIPSDHIITGWSPDGAFFLTVCGVKWKPDPAAQLYLMNRDGTEHKALSSEKESVLVGRFSAGGKYVLYASVPLPLPKKPDERVRPYMVLFDLTTGKANRVQDVPLNAELLDFCWAPDGKRIAYLWRQIHEGETKEGALEKETEYHLIVCDPDGKNQKTVLSEKGTGRGSVLTELDWR